MKKIKLMLLLLLSAFVMSACSKEVITVAGIVSEDSSESNYIEMQEFELKTQEESSGRDDISYCAVLVPVGYVESSEIPGMYIHERAPLDSSNIYYSTAPATEAGQISESLTEAMYKQMVETAYSEAGQSIELQVKSFEQIDMEGVPGYKIRSAYAVGEEQIEQLAYIILADNTCTVTYSQLSDDELFADFEISDGEIRLVKEPEVQMAKK